MAIPTCFVAAQEYMDRARTLWDELGLPKLQPREPWFGYELGYWSEEERDEAELALAGKHYEVGERAEKNRKKL